MVLKTIPHTARHSSCITRRWAIEACKTFFGLTDADERAIVGLEGKHYLQKLWQTSPDTFYDHPLQMLRQEWFHASKAWYRHDGFWAALPPQAMVLDYGCGTGEVARLPWILRGEALDAHEHSATCRAYLQWKYRHYAVVTEDTASLSQSQPAAYDALICTDVLEHLPNPLEVQRMLWEKLKPGGHALLKFATEWPHPGHLRDAIVQRPQWVSWLRDQAQIIEVDTYCWCRKQ